MLPSRSVRILLMAAALAATSGYTIDTASAAGARTADTARPTAAAAIPGGALTLGPTSPLGNGTIRGYVVSDAVGHPLEVGLRMTGAALQGLPMGMDGMPKPVIVTFPSYAGAIDHAEVYWNPHGHEPAGLFDKPHFDFHFYLVDPAAVRAIDPAKPGFAAHADHLPEAQYMPRDFVLPPGGAAANAVPGMGVHWLDSTDGLVPGHYDFTRVMINGSWDGEYTFIEPMITRAWLLAKNSVTEKLKQPRAYQQTARYPTTYSVRYDRDIDEYSITMGGMTPRHAS
jgi:hypothetical protein